MLLPLTLTTPKLFEDVLWIQHILYNVIFYTTENLPVIFWKSMWETLSQDTPERSSCSFIPREHGFQTQALYSPLWGLPWCLRDTEPNLFSYQGRGQKWPELPSQKPKFKAIWGEPTQEGDRGGFSGEDTTSAGPCALPTSEQAEVDQGTNQTSHQKAL